MDPETEYTLFKMWLTQVVMPALECAPDRAGATQAWYAALTPQEQAHVHRWCDELAQAAVHLMDQWSVAITAMARAMEPAMQTFDTALRDWFRAPVK